MAKIGYARVSTADQSTDAQVSQLTALGCEQIFKENISGGRSDRPELAAALRSLKPGDKLIVTKLDRLARSLSDLLDIISRIEGQEAYFESVSDTISTSSAQGRFFLHIIGAVAEFERGLIHERTMNGLAQARANGRVGGNPNLRSRNPKAIATLTEARDQTYLNKLNSSAEQWVPIVKRLRPDQPWEDVIKIVNVALRNAGKKTWSIDRLKRAAKRYVREGHMDASVLNKAPRLKEISPELRFVSGLVNQNPGIKLKTLAAELHKQGHTPPRGRGKWALSSVKSLIDRGKKLGIIDQYIPSEPHT
jgi:DNA invertase Pin-like site-specific DNA recombinase